MNIGSLNASKIKYCISVGIIKTHISKTWHDVLNMDRNKKEEKFSFHNQLRIWCISVMQ